MKPAQQFIQKRLDERRDAGNFRSLKQPGGLLDFCSNDYLGFAQSSVLKKEIDAEIERSGLISNGSTGSRLLSGNSAYAEELEQHLASLYGVEAGLIFNSGYDANLGLFSSLPQRGDTVISDELVHASIIDGMRLSYANRYSFKHNDLASLEEKLKLAKGICYVVIESVYSMDGDTPPIKEILGLADKYNAHLIVDEAHAVGLFGFGLVTGQDRQRVFARIVTFGKALGCHGAIVFGTSSLKDYLVNFARSFIYTTAPTFHNLASVKAAHQVLQNAGPEVDALRGNIEGFKRNIRSNAGFPVIKSDSSIQCIVLKERTKQMANHLQSAGLDVRPILSPTVAAGSERIRICLHSFNSAEEISLLTNLINEFIDG